MNLDFKLHPQLQQDTLFIEHLKISDLRLMNDERFPWLVLIPRKNNIIELHDLEKKELIDLLDEITSVSKTLQRLFQADKMNIATFGNIVPQLHVHIIARFKTDPAWPKPVFGFEAPVPYSTNKAQQMITNIREIIGNYHSNYSQSEPANATI